MNRSMRTAARRVRDLAIAWRGRLDSRFSRRAQRAVKGRRILITGATGGIGEATAAELVKCGAMVLVHGRSTERIDATVARLSAQARRGAQVTSYQADLSDPAQIERLIQQVQQDHPLLDGLINNAAVGYVPERRVDSRGLEWVWAINVLAPWHLAQGLAPLLSKGDDARVINLVSSLAHEVGDDLMLEHGYDPVHAYARSNQALIVLGVALAEEFRAYGISVNALDPGTIDTPMATGFAQAGLGMPPRRAGMLLGRMIADPSLSRQSGRLYSLGRRISLPEQAVDKSFRRRLVAIVLRQLEMARQSASLFATVFCI